MGGGGGRCLDTDGGNVHEPILPCGRLPLSTGRRHGREGTAGATAVGIPIRAGDGSVFGTMCGLHPTAPPTDLLAQEPGLRLLADLLGCALEAEKLRAEADARTTELQQQACALASSEALHRLLAEHSVDVIGRYSPDGTVRYVSPAVHALLGFTPAEFEGTRTSDLLHPDDLAELFEVDGSLRTDGGELTFRLRHREGHWVGIERVATIVRAMKTFSHPGHKEQTPADLNEALAATITVTRHQVSDVADFNLELGDLPPVRCDIAELNQVFLNLLVNAADAVGETGARGRIDVTTAVDGDQAVVRISDTGTGIPDDVVMKIFDPFFTTKEVGRGTGQGLPLARAVVQEGHGGSRTVDSEPGRGTTFTIRIPVDGLPQPAPAG